MDRTRPLATPAQVSDYLGVAVHTLAQWRYRRTGPRFIRVGRHVRYDWRDLEAWQAQQTQETAA